PAPRGKDRMAAGGELERVTGPAVVEGEVIVLDADDAKTSSGGRPRRARLERDGQRDKGIRRRPAHRHGWIDVTVRALDQILRHRAVEYISREQREVVARREAERRGTSGGRRAERRVIDQITISGGGDAPGVHWRRGHSAGASVGGGRRRNIEELGDNRCRRGSAPRAERDGDLDGPRRDVERIEQRPGLSRRGIRDRGPREISVRLVVRDRERRARIRLDTHDEGVAPAGGIRKADVDLTCRGVSARLRSLDVLDEGRGRRRLAVGRRYE